MCKLREFNEQIFSLSLRDRSDGGAHPPISSFPVNELQQGLRKFLLLLRDALVTHIFCVNLPVIYE